MTSDGYLLLGLNALARAHQTDYFADGHRGAAIIAACLFCREAGVEEGAPESLRAMVDAHWAQTDLCAPYPAEDPDPQGVERILHCLAERLPGLRQAGHNVILPSLALRAFSLVPGAATPSRAAGRWRSATSSNTPTGSTG